MRLNFKGVTNKYETLGKGTKRGKKKLVSSIGLFCQARSPLRLMGVFLQWCINITIPGIYSQVIKQQETALPSILSPYGSGDKTRAPFFTNLGQISRTHSINRTHSSHKSMSVGCKVTRKFLTPLRQLLSRVWQSIPSTSSQSFSVPCAT